MDTKKETNKYQEIFRLFLLLIFLIWIPISIFGFGVICMMWILMSKDWFFTLTNSLLLVFWSYYMIYSPIADVKRHYLKTLNQRRFEGGFKKDKEKGKKGKNAKSSFSIAKKGE
ncbi:hypothetical protein [Enterococcus sp. LJL51]|uniref:hypothetical protein n=1 Tax=Enterococcus sp. LJL51 TaxID=3416656 RepID=UPI003CF125D5